MSADRRRSSCRSTTRAAGRRPVTARLQPLGEHDLLKDLIGVAVAGALRGAALRATLKHVSER